MAARWHVFDSIVRERAQMCHTVNSMATSKQYGYHTNIMRTADHQHVHLCNNFASMLKLIPTCDSLSLSWTVWPCNGMNSKVLYVKERIMVEMWHAVNSMVRRRTLCPTSDQQHVHLCINVASMLKLIPTCDSLSLTWTVWPCNGMNSRVWYVKEHIMVEMWHTVNSMVRR
jgi:hypothetical protein